MLRRISSFLRLLHDDATFILGSIIAHLFLYFFSIVMIHIRIFFSVPDTVRCECLFLLEGISYLHPNFGVFRYLIPAHW